MMENTMQSIRTIHEEHGARPVSSHQHLFIVYYFWRDRIFQQFAPCTIVSHVTVVILVRPAESQVEGSCHSGSHSLNVFHSPVGNS